MGSGPTLKSFRDYNLEVINKIFEQSPIPSGFLFRSLESLILDEFRH